MQQILLWPLRHAAHRGTHALRESAAVATMATMAIVIGVVAPALADNAHADRATSHRRFNDVAHWSSVFDDPKRDEWQQPDRIVAALKLEPGMSVADIGAGTGYFSRRLSSAVGASGAVFVVEVEPNLVTHLRDRAETEKTANVIPVLASADNPRLPAASIDLALFVDAYHHVDGRLAYLAVLKRALRAGGRVAIVEWKPGKQPVGPPEEDHKLAREQVIREMTGAGFEAVETPDFLRHQYFALFRMVSPPTK